jgi:hypothetical protein
MRPFEGFVRLLIEWPPPGPSLNLSIKYRGDDQIYMAWVPPLGCRVTDGHLPDPGFGSGPVRLDEIELLEVHDYPSTDRPVPRYAENYAAFVEKVRSLNVVEFVAGGIRVMNAG